MPFAAKACSPLYTTSQDYGQHTSKHEFGQSSQLSSAAHRSGHQFQFTSLNSYSLGNQVGHGEVATQFGQQSTLRSKTCTVNPRRDSHCDRHGTSGPRSSSRPRRTSYQDEALKSQQQDTALLQQMAHPLLKLMSDPTRPLSSSRHANVAAIRSPSSHDLAKSVTQAATSIAQMLGRGQSVELFCDDIPADFVMASISMALFIAGCEDRQQFIFKTCSEESRQKLSSVWKKWQQLPISSIQRLEPQGFGYMWVCEDNTYESRLQRQAAAMVTLFNGFDLPLRKRMVDTTILIRGECTSVVSYSNRSQRKSRMIVETGTAMDVATNYAKNNQRVAVVNAASAFQVGGGFLSGGRHALEEALCMQSTLYFSLQQASRIAEKDHLTARSGQPIHIPEDGAVLSPDVEVFRSGSAQGYGSIPKVQLAAVLSIAMPNKNPRVNNNPVWWGSDREYKSLIAQKFRAVLEGAIEVQAKVLVFPDVGCGVFQNDPRTIGKVLGEVLLEFDGKIDMVLLVGSRDFAMEVQSAYSSR